MDTAMDLSQKTAFLSGAHIANTFITNEWKFNLAHSVNNFFVLAPLIIQV